MVENNVIPLQHGTVWSLTATSAAVCFVAIGPQVFPDRGVKRVVEVDPQSH